MSMPLSELIKAFLVLVTIFLTDAVSSLSMQGRHFKTAVREQATSMKFIRNPNGTIVGYSGVNYELFHWISQKLKFTYTFIPVFEFRAGPLPNGSWVGAYEMIRKKEVDFIANAVFLVPSVQRVLDFTATCAEIPDVFLVPYPQEETRLLAPVKPFTFTVWVLLFGCIVILSSAIYGIVTAEHPLTAKNRKKSPLYPGHVGLTVTGVLLGQTEFPVTVRQSNRMRILLSLFCLTAVVLVNSYTGTFISFAATPKLMPVLEGADDIAFRSGLMYVGTDSQDLDMFINSTNKGMRKFGESLLNPKNVFPSIPAAAEKVATGCCAMLCPRVVLEAWLSADLQKHGKCRCTITQKPVIWDFYAFGCQKGSPFCQSISKELMVAKEIGLITYWWSNQIKSPYQCLNPEKPKYRKLSVKDLSGVFAVFTLGVSFSATVFVIEVLTNKLLTFQR